MSEIFGKLLEVKPHAWFTIGAVIILSIIGLFIISRNAKPSSTTLRTKKIVYGGICISISFILSYIRILHMPQGGSITLASMFPLVLYSMIFGPISGIIAGIAYGLLQLIQDMYVLNPLQFLLDYPLAFGCIGLAGLAPRIIKNLYARTTLAIFIAFFGRAFMHIVSGALFFGEYAPDGMNPFIYSLTYNGILILGEFIITLILSYILITTPAYAHLKKTLIPSLNS